MSNHMGVVFRASSYSAYNGNCLETRFQASSHSAITNCLEVAFRKSSHSFQGDCTEAALQGGVVLIRDSKQAPKPGHEGPTGPELPFSPVAWAEFLATIK